MKFSKMYKDLAMTNYFIFRYNNKLASSLEIFDEEILDVPN